MQNLELEAYIYGHKIGTLLLYEGVIYFEYSKSFRALGLEISPIKLNTKKITSLYTNSDSSYFQGLAGVFFDSLPDSYGMSFIDRYFESKEYNVKDLSLLHKLSFIGSNAMGAIEYRPNIFYKDKMLSKVLKAKETHQRLKDILSYKANIEAKELMQIVYGASPIGGGRPKMLVCYNPNSDSLRSNAQNLPPKYKRAIIKFDEAYYNNESIELTKLEFIYMQLAKECGINIPNIYLHTQDGLSHLIIERFDRDSNDQKIHTSTASALLHKDIRVPQVGSYEELFALTNHICKKQIDIEELYRRMVFNLYSYNVDDHMKNFSFIMAKDGTWSLAPAYDITFSYGVVKNHLTTLRGKSSNFCDDDLLYMAKKALISTKKAKQIIEQTKETLSSFEQKAKDVSLSTNLTKEVSKMIDINLKNSENR